MSMTVDKTNYQGAQEIRPERKDRDVAPEDIKKQQDVRETPQTGQPGKPQYDTVEISEDGRTASAKFHEGAGGMQTHTAHDSLNSVYISKDGIVSVKDSIQQKTELTSAGNLADNGKEQNETEDLSQYTDAELKLMYYNGDITRQDYEDETGEKL